MTMTPWGPSQESRQIAPGITFHSTAGHGGIHLDRQHQAAFRKLFPEFKPFAGAPWYEEDCDYAVIVLAFPEHFRHESIRNAIQSVRCSANYRESGNYAGWQSVIRWLDGDSITAIGLRSIFHRVEGEMADTWERGGYCSLGRERKLFPEGTWQVSFTRVRDQSRKTIYMPYPEKQFYTDEELAAIERKPAQVAQPPAFRESDCSGVFDGFSVTSDADPGL